MLTFFGYSQNVPAVRFQPSIHGPETCGVGVHIFRWLEWILPLAWVHSTNKNLFGGIPDCKSLPGGAFELRWCLDAWDEQCIDDDGTLFQWVMILGSLVLFSSLRQQTPADSRLHQNWSCNASPWRFLSINHSYFLHEGYLKIYIYMIYITPYESLVFLWRPNTLVKLVGCWRYWTVPSVAILLSWSLRFEVASCWWGTCCYSCFFWCRSCRKKIAKSVIPPNLGEYF